MIFLAIDCGSEYLSLALKQADKINIIKMQVGSKQTEHVLVEISKLAKEANIELCELSAIFYNAGPASFTGLRIGLSVALSLAYAYKIELYPINSFQLYYAYALQSNKIALNERVAIAIDARMSQVYYTIMQNNQIISELQVLAPDEIENFADKILGNGAQVYNNSKWLSHYTETINSDYPDASSMFYWLDKTLAVDYANADLLYLRNKIALTLVEQQAAKDAKTS